MGKKKIYFLAVATVALVCAGCLYLSLYAQTVHLAYMVDSKYVPYMMVSLESAVLNKNRESRYHIYVIASDLTGKDISAIKSMERSKVKIEIVSAGKLPLDFSHLGRFSSFEVALQKLFIADYLPSEKKVLYLDADTLVQDDLSAVYHTDLQGNYAAAVKDGLMYQFPQHIAEIGLSSGGFYFNSGVMLLNLQKIRRDGISRRAIIYFNTHSNVFGDQDVLNAVFGEKVKPLSYRYNCNSTFFEEKDAGFLSGFWNEKVAARPEEVYNSAVILHFAGHKPWTQWFMQDYLKRLWRQYAAIVSAKYRIVF